MDEINVNLQEVQDQISKFGQGLVGASHKLMQNKEFAEQHFPEEMLAEYTKMTEHEESMINELCEEFEQMKLSNDNDWNELMEYQKNMNPEENSNISKEKLIEYLTKRAETRSNDKVADNYHKLITQLKNSNSLDNIKEGIKRIKNPSKIRCSVDENYDKVFKKLTLSMKEAVRLKFINPKYLLNALVDSGFTLEDA